MTEAEKRRYIDYLSMVDKLGQMRDEGVDLYLDGREADPADIAREYIFNEPDTYMRGFYLTKDKDS